MTNQEPQVLTHLVWLERVSKLMDSQFKIPGTNYRFGLDFLIGLVPYAGDVMGFGMGGVLIMAMWRHGASVGMILKMLGNIGLDAIIGTIPVIGDLFDLTYKANNRNVAMLKAYYADGTPKPSAKKSLLFLGIIFFVLLLVLMILLWKVMAIGVAWAWVFFKQLT
jgi:Domain of unknown function (DUF4112)